MHAPLSKSNQSAIKSSIPCIVFPLRVSVHQMPDVVSQSDIVKPVLVAVLTLGQQYIDPITNLMVQ